MVAPRQPRPRTPSLELAGLGLIALLSGCASPGGDGPSTLPPQTLTAPAPTPESGITVDAEDPAATPLPNAATPPIRLPGEDEDGVTRLDDVDVAASPNLVIIGSSEPQPEAIQQSLVAAAMAERARRRDAEPARVVVNDKNLSTFTDGSLTILKEPVADALVSSTKPVSPAATEAYWRQRARALRQDWADTAKEVVELQKDADRLRTRFYAADDPFTRDTQIKPAWDRVLDQLAEARESVADKKSAVDSLIEEGRRAGALPGWLREGSELEPSRNAEKAPSLPAPSEPVIAPEPVERH